MNTTEAAAALDGNQYRKEGSKELFAAMKAAGLVAVFGGSDDLMEFEGAISDEVGAGSGSIEYLDKDGLIKSDCVDDCPYFERLKDKAAFITANWDVDGFSWTYTTAIPHKTFIIKEDDDNYCRGIVFCLEDVR